MASTTFETLRNYVDLTKPRLLPLVLRRQRPALIPGVKLDQPLDQFVGAAFLRQPGLRAELAQLLTFSTFGISLLWFSAAASYAGFW